MNADKMTCHSENHQDHMCSLQAMGATAEIKRLSSKPTVECGICGAKANSVENICTPVKVWQEEQLS